MVPKRESVEAKAKWELEFIAAECKAQEAKALVCTTAGHAYDLFRQALKNEPQTQWDHITMDMHTKDPWHEIVGEKQLKPLNSGLKKVAPWASWIHQILAARWVGGSTIMVGVFLCCVLRSCLVVVTRRM